MVRDPSNFGRKQDAIDFGRGIGKNLESELVIHKKDGTIQNTDSYGGDPCPLQNKKNNANYKYF